jgi:ribonuclease HI
MARLPNPATPDKGCVIVPRFILQYPTMAMFISWNCRGFVTNHAELQLLLRDTQPLIVFLQETLLKPTDNPKVKGYTLHRLDYTAGERAQGGVAILVHDSVFAIPLVLASRLQVVAVMAHVPTPTTFCCVYLPPPLNVTRLDLEALIFQLPGPFILAGDFNAHHVDWGSTVSDPRGCMVTDFLQHNDVSLLNTDQMTHFTSYSGSLSAIDLVLCTPMLLLDLELLVVDDLHGSDHFPLQLTYHAYNRPFNPGQGWKLAKADWGKFQELSEEALLKVDFTCSRDPNALVNAVGDCIMAAASASIPVTSCKQRRHPVPWWNVECAIAVKARKASYRRLSKYPTVDNLQAFQRQRAKTRRVIKLNKKRSWIEYVSTITHSTPSTTVWKKVKAISGRPVNTIPAIRDNGQIITTPHDVASVLGRHFASVSSNARYDADFLIRKQRCEARPLDFHSENTEPYNRAFNIWELRTALRSLRRTSVGEDNLHNDMFLHLTEASLEIILLFFNVLWLSDIFPDEWRNAILIPILKPGKDKSAPGSYRPISLTSCFCKLFEKMINKRLMWVLETRGLLANVQCGFRQRRCTIDHLVRLETFVQEGFVAKQHVVGVLFDIEKAYDTTWRYGIMRQLHEWDFRGHMPKFLSNFLKDRHFKVRVNNILSDRYDLQTGVPQGSVLSVPLFAIGINSVIDSIPRSVMSSFFVDDLGIFYRSVNLSIIERHLQTALNNIGNWARERGTRFSPEKTQCIHFCRLRGIQHEPRLMFNNVQLQFKPHVRLLGMEFDSKLNWRHHIVELRKRSMLALNIIKVLSNSSWGADRTCLLRIYGALIRSKMDYGCFVYSSARDSNLKLLDTVHHTGLRIALGAFRTSPVVSLYAEAGESSLAERRNYLMGTYVMKIRAMPNHPCNQTLFSERFVRHFDNKPLATQPTGMRIRNFFSLIGFVMPKILNFVFSNAPPWVVPEPVIIFDLCRFDKTSTCDTVFKNNFLEICHEHQRSTLVFTDGSKIDNKVGCAFYCATFTERFRLHDMCSVFTAELVAIREALKYILRCPNGEFLICSDSLSGLQAISLMYSSHHLIIDIHFYLGKLISSGYTIQFCWVPGHVGIDGNEHADQAAKAACQRRHVDFDVVPVPDVKSGYKKHLLDLRQASWDRVQNNKLHNVMPTLKHKIRPPASRLSRRDEVLLARLRIGHTRLTHGHLLTREKVVPQCDTCDVPLTIRHVLSECIKHDALRTELKLSQSYEELLSYDNCNLLLKFLIKSDLSHQI